MTARARFSQADVRRALRAAEGLGLGVAGYKIEPDGSILVLTEVGSAANFNNPLDRLHG